MFLSKHKITFNSVEVCFFFIIIFLCYFLSHTHLLAIWTESCNSLLMVVRLFHCRHIMYHTVQSKGRERILLVPAVQNLRRLNISNIFSQNWSIKNISKFPKHQPNRTQSNKINSNKRVMKNTYMPLL